MNYLNDLVKPQDDKHFRNTVGDVEVAVFFCQSLCYLNSEVLHSIMHACNSSNVDGTNCY